MATQLATDSLRPAESPHRKRTVCRTCGGDRLRPFLSLGPVPLANSFLRSGQEFAEEPSYPLDVYLCEQCFLVQLLDVIDAEVLFRNYIYVTGTSDTMAAHNAHYARSVVQALALGPRDLVVEVASNDGSLLQCFRRCGVRTLGVEPARSIAEQACASGIDTLSDFFDPAVAARIRNTRGPARAVVANNVLAHVDEPRDFLAGCRHLLADDGLVVVEVPYLRDLLDRLEYDTIYHEHLSYFSAAALMRLCDASGLRVVRLDRLPVHGGSLRLYAAPRRSADPHSDDARRLAEQEHQAGLQDFALYQRFARDVDANRRRLRALLHGLRDEGYAVAGYGAPAKGNTLLNYCGIDPRLLPYTVDKNPWKVGLFTPGAHIPVLPVSTLIERQPDYVLLLAWNFADEIQRQQQPYRDRGGRFIVPIPDPKIIHSPNPAGAL